MAALESSFSSSHIPNGLKLRSEALSQLARPPNVALADYFEIGRVASAVHARRATHVALQFPEALLSDAADVVWALEDALDDLAAASGAEDHPTPLVYILGDTAFGEASVDEVAAAHLPTDFIVHFGPSTLTPTAGKVPVLHVFGQRPLDPHAAAAAIAAALPRCSPGSAAPPEGSAAAAPEQPHGLFPPVVLVYDAAYGAGVPPVAAALRALGVARVAVGAPPSALDYGHGGRGGGAAEPQRSCCGGGGDDAGESGCGCEAGSSAPDGCCEQAPTFHATGGDEGEGAAAAASAGVVLVGGLEVDLGCLGLRLDGEGGDGDQGGDLGDDRGSDLGDGDKAEAALAQCCVVFVGADGWQLSSVLMRCDGGNYPSLLFDPAGGSGGASAGVGGGAVGSDDGSGGGAACVPARCVSVDLRRRYYQVQKASGAQVVGVVVGTLGVRHFRRVLNRVVALVEAAGRKAYVLAVGAPNVAKLTNFPEVGVFVLVASPETALGLDARDFPVPVLTPLELEVALGGRAWLQGGYSTDFDDFLRAGNAAAAAAVAAAGGGAVSDGGASGGGGMGGMGGGMGGSEAGAAPVFSLVTGRHEDRRKHHLRLAFDGDDDGGDSGDGSCGGGGGGGGGSGSMSRELAAYHSPAAVFLAARSYQGLEVRLGQDAAHAAVEGRDGVASDYGERSLGGAPKQEGAAPQAAACNAARPPAALGLPPRPDDAAAAADDDAAAAARSSAITCPGEDEEEEEEEEEARECVGDAAAGFLEGLESSDDE